MGFGDYLAALEMRDIIKGLVKGEVEKQRPRYDYATVTAIDRPNRKCTVQYPGDTTTSVVNMGAVQPSATGQVVRVDGLLGDRFVSDVMGTPYVEQPPNSLIAAGTDLDNVVTPGSYIQNANVNATLALHYPVTYAGSLEVTYQGPSGMVYQQYQVYSSSPSLPNSVWVRGRYTGIWSAWKMLAWDADLATAENRISVLEDPATNRTFTGTVSIPQAGDLILGDSATLTGAGWNQVEYALRAQGMGLSGGGTRTVTSTAIAWSQRFLGLGFGRDATTLTSGYFDVVMPPDGTVIPGLAGAANQTVSGGLIPFVNAVALYYIPPFGGSGGGSFPANFRLVGWTADYSVPNSWVMVAVRNADTGIVQWSDGQTDSGWVTLSLNAGFSVPSGWNPQVRRLNDYVSFRGYVTGSAGFTYGSYTTICNVPALYRPTQPLGFSVGFNTTASVGAISVQTDGSFQAWLSATTAAWVTFSAVSYPVG